VLDGHKDVVFGIDMVNEIQAASQNGVFPDASNGPRAFLQREASFIKSKLPWVKVTSSAGWASGLGLDFYDVHV